MVRRVVSVKSLPTRSVEGKRQYVLLRHAFFLSGEHTMDSNFRRMVSVEIGSVYFTSHGNPTANSKANDNPISVR
jgi:hypothetical protein